LQDITLISSLPPIKWITPYTIGLVGELEKHSHVTLIGFDNLYPDSLYKRSTGTSSKDTNSKLPKLNNTTIYQILNWYNPFSWISAGLKARWDTLHLQHWIWITVPIYITIILIAKYIKWMQVVITVHNVVAHEKSWFKPLLDKILYGFCDKFIVHSEDNKKQLINIIWNDKSITVIPHGMITPNCEKVEKKTAREKYDIWEDRKVLLFFWNIRDYKWLDILLESFSELVRQDSSYFLIIAGTCWENWEKYQSIIDINDLSSHILRINRFIPENEQWYIFWTADLMILPYRYFDAQSGVLALNFYFSLPVIISDQWWLMEVIDDKDLIFESGNIKELTEKVLFLFKKDILINKKIYVKERGKWFSWKTLTKNFLLFYYQ
jgi:glycosyltransferase involved in cell wall biosynthesis